jgi:hypothetical protein
LQEQECKKAGGFIRPFCMGSRPAVSLYMDGSKNHSGTETGNRKRHARRAIRRFLWAWHFHTFHIIQVFYVIKVVNSLPINSHEGKFIRKVREDGLIEN